MSGIKISVKSFQVLKVVEVVLVMVVKEYGSHMTVMPVLVELLNFPTTGL